MNSSAKFAEARDVAHSKSSNHAALVIFGLDTVWLLAMLCWALFEPSVIISAVGAAAAWVSIIPVCSKSYRFLSPWTMVAFTLHLGVLARSFYVIVAPVSSQDDIDTLFLLGASPDSFLIGSLAFLSGVAIATFSYLFFNPSARARLNFPLARLEFRPSIIIPTIIFAGVGAMGLIMYIRATGDFSLADISSKRSVIDGLDVGDDYSSHGVIRFINSFGQVALWCYIGKTVFDDRDFSYFSVRGLFILILAINAVALPFYASSRSSVGFVLLVAVAVDIGARRRVPSLIAALSGVIGTGIALVFMTLSRGLSTESEGTIKDFGSGLEGLLLLNRNFGDFFTFTHIVQAIPGSLDWARGSSIVPYLVAPIPRAIWHDKPLISVGPTIGINVYGNERSGVPPGWFAEWYWNFGIVGFIFGSVLLGVSLKYIASRLQFPEWNSAVLIVVYAVVFFRFGYFALGGGVGSTIFKTAVQFATLSIFLFFAGRFVQNKGELVAAD